MTDARPFWESKQLTDMSPAEWESLCDGCGKCCLYKLEDIDTGEIAYTNVACRLLDAGTCRCSDYQHRFEKVEDCTGLTPEDIPTFRWLPATCAYRLLSEGKTLAVWHPLVSGDPDSVHRAGISVRGRVISEDEADDDLEMHVIDGQP